MPSAKAEATDNAKPAEAVWELAPGGRAVTPTDVPLRHPDNALAIAERAASFATDDGVMPS
jgi:hypothetical protein